MLLVTFHGGSNGLQNVGCFADSGANAGECLKKDVLTGMPHAKEFELRGIELHKGELWVANGAKGKSSSVMVFKPGPGRYEYTWVRTFVDSTTTTAINHPFAFSFDDKDNCYVSNQDTNVVARFTPAGSPLDATTLPQASTPVPNYNPGTFVASSEGGLDGTSPTVPVPRPKGLFYSPATGKVQNSVRDVLYYAPWTVLFVCDEADHAVKVYDMDGNYLASIATATSSPTHLAIANPPVQNVPPALYISSGTQIFSYPLSSSSAPQGDVTAVAVISGLEAAAGLSFDGSGSLYVADRKARVIDQYVNNSGKWEQEPKNSPIVPKSSLDDDPEFIFHVKN